MSDSTRVYAGLGVLNMVGTALVVGKLFEVDPVAGWSWWLVLSPFLVQLALLALALIVLGVVWFVAKLFEPR